MRASEWQFLCAVHETPKSCCAIDYCCHTLDWATNIVTSQKIFPSRLSLGAGDGLDERGAGVKHLVNIFRRLHRIFAHAWFQHRGVFWQIEGQTGLYVLFKTVCDNYELLPAENYKLPPEAEGLEPIPETKIIPTILKPEPVSLSNVENIPSEDQSFIGASRTTTRRHIRSSPSTGSAVTTVLEADEDDSDVTQKLSELSVTKEEEAEADMTLIGSDIKVNIESQAAPPTQLEAQGNEAEIPVAVAPEEGIESPVDLPMADSISTHLEEKTAAVSPVISDEPPSVIDEDRPHRKEEEELILEHSNTEELNAGESAVPDVYINQP
jgi:Mob1/phocein family